MSQHYPSTAAITYSWQVLRRPNPTVSYMAFVHFVDDVKVTATSEGIVFQGDHLPISSTPQWRPGTIVTDGPIATYIPTSIADGTYSIRIGLYDPATGNRLPLAGPADATGRIIVGYITLSNHGSKIAFAPPLPQPDDPRLNATNSIVDFGKIKTDGMVSLSQINGNWILRPFPRTRNVNILLNKEDFPMPATVQTDAGSIVIPIDAQAYWQVPINSSKTYSWPVH
jgi:hypothetical protein